MTFLKRTSRSENSNWIEILLFKISLPLDTSDSAQSFWLAFIHIFFIWLLNVSLLSIAIPNITSLLLFSRRIVKYKLIIVAVFPKAQVMTFFRVQNHIIIIKLFSHCTIQSLHCFRFKNNTQTYASYWEFSRSAWPLYEIAYWPFLVFQKGWWIFENSIYDN